MDEGQHLKQGHELQNVQELSESKCEINRSRFYCLRSHLIEVNDNERSIGENVFQVEMCAFKTLVV